ncbi:MAG: hypothetical protein M0R30_03235 [Methanoregula sp.]|uniref:hypothetical protein n=1 Tax=Methanoregula sp. TaxID=2052170 RepID=UPI0025F870E8|nr:hypothetical protein [Methanoregula sp.]MCK9630635.1 hypothetical protein [Methanoregula sp.]
MTAHDDEKITGSPGTPVRRIEEVSGKPLRREVRQTAGLRSEEVSGKPLRREVRLAAGLRSEEVSGKPLRREVRLAAELRSEGIAGPSREVSKRDDKLSGAGGAGREDEELEWARRHVGDDRPERRPVRTVFRKTELALVEIVGIAPGAGKYVRRSRRESVA